MSHRLRFSMLLLAAAGLALVLLGGLHLARNPVEAQPVAAELVLYWDSGGEGRSLIVTDTVLDLSGGVDESGEPYDWNDQVSSVLVRSGTWRLYENGRCNTELDGTDLESLDLSTKPSVDGWSCLISGSTEGPVLYNFGGGSGFANDRISSIELVSQENLPSWATPR